MIDFLRLLAGTVQLRPYVFIFLAVYIIAAAAHLGWRRTLFYIPLGYCLAWISEFSSIHVGFPYGDYFYIPHTLDKELWVFGVPFMDSLSYVFLSYCSYSTAIFLLSPVVFTSKNIYVLETHKIRRSFRVLILGAFLFVLLDIIIDPVALQGHRWFLGQIYGYRSPGIYFGIPMSNFGGWLFVGFVMVAALQYLDRLPCFEAKRKSFWQKIPGIAIVGPLLYISVPGFNLSVTFWIGELLLGTVGCLIIFFPLLLGLYFTLYKQGNLTPEHIEQHVRDFPFSGATRLLS
ncbi:MAG: carotenoid biosynthesis protein [Syntrophobacteraceae bacterium]